MNTAYCWRQMSPKFNIYPEIMSCKSKEIPEFNELVANSYLNRQQINIKVQYQFNSCLEVHIRVSLEPAWLQTQPQIIYSPYYLWYWRCLLSVTVSSPWIRRASTKEIGELGKGQSLKSKLTNHSHHDSSHTNMLYSSMLMSTCRTHFARSSLTKEIS